MVVGLMFVAGCSGSDSHDHQDFSEKCMSDTECHTGEICHAGYCELASEHENE